MSILFRLPNFVPTQNQGSSVLNNQLQNLWTSLHNASLSAGTARGIPSFVPPAPKRVAITSGSDAFTLDYANPEVTHSKLNRINWQVVERAGTKPIIGNGGENLRTMKIMAIVGDIGGQAIDNRLSNLRYMMAVPGALTIAYGGFEGGVAWRCTDFQATTKIRVPGTNDTWWAEVNLEFTEDSPAPYPTVVPATPAPNPVPPPAAPGEPPRNVYTVKKGDTLSAIAVREYGNASAWPKIADANGIKDPRKLQVGQQLVIP